MKKTIKTLQNYPNGLVVFAGNTLEEGFRITFISPPVKVKTKIYQCHKRFYTDVLRKDLDTTQGHTIYIYIDGNECLLYTCIGTDTRLLWKKKVSLDSNTSRGGQSQARHSRNRDIQKQNYLTICVDNIMNHLLELSKTGTLSSIFVAGKGNFVHQLLKSDFKMLDHKIYKKCVSNSSDIHVIKQESEKYLQDTVIKNEKDVLTRINYLLEHNTDLVKYGKDQVYKYLDMGLVKELYSSDKDTLEQYKGYLIKYLYISDKTELAQTFYKIFQGHVAILYYPTEDTEDIEENQE